VHTYNYIVNYYHKYKCVSQIETNGPILPKSLLDLLSLFYPAAGGDRLSEIRTNGWDSIDNKTLQALITNL